MVQMLELHLLEEIAKTWRELQISDDTDRMGEISQNKSKLFLLFFFFCKNTSLANSFCSLRSCILFLLTFNPRSQLGVGTQAWLH